MIDRPDNEVVLHLCDLQVLNRSDQQATRLVPRRFSLDGFDLKVQRGQRVLVVAGWGAGKGTLIYSILNQTSGVKLNTGYTLIPVSQASDIMPGTGKIVFLKDGFDFSNSTHVAIVRAAEAQNATLVGTAEIDKLAGLQQSGLAGIRVVVADDGRVVADIGVIPAESESRVVCGRS